MIRRQLESWVQQAVQALLDRNELPAGDYPAVEVTEPKSAEHGDYACNFALASSKMAKKNPREVATALAEELKARPEIESVDIAGPGFINFRLSQAWLCAQLAQVLRLGPGHLREAERGYAFAEAENPQRINVEYVSVNPNGPITIGSGRGAAFGDTLANVLQAAGHTVWREYYVNDGVNSEQMRLFAESVRALAKGEPVPEDGYKGDYVQAVADKVKQKAGDLDNASTADIQEMAQELMLERQRVDLARFGVAFDRWFSEHSLHKAGAVEQALEQLRNRQAADEEPYQTVVEYGKKGEIKEQTRLDQPTEDLGPGEQPALWLRSAQFGDEKDRVLVRKDGRPTYIAADVAYHKSKLERLEEMEPQGAPTKLIDVLGPDHHGYINRLKAVVQALGYDRDQLEVTIFQIVRFLKEGKPAPMRKRDGNIYALSDLMQEIGEAMRPDASPEGQLQTGADVVRYFYLMRSHETHMDFDVDLAKSQSEENPVFYVQYAHARISSLMTKALEAGLHPPKPEEADALLSKLNHEAEKALTLKIFELPNVVERSAKDYGVHRLTTYAQELARNYSIFYDRCRVIDPENEETSRARLALCQATQVALKATFRLLGISEPDSM